MARIEIHIPDTATEEQERIANYLYDVAVIENSPCEAFLYKGIYDEPRTLGLSHYDGILLEIFEDNAELDYIEGVIYDLEKEVKEEKELIQKNNTITQ
jgi:hypothetical protein